MSGYLAQVQTGNIGAQVSTQLFNLGYALEGRYVPTDKGRHSREMQKRMGDYIIVGPGGEMQCIEVKTESKARPNFYLENWSNRTFSERPPTHGWLLTLDCDQLFYYFAESGDLYIIDYPKLREWAFGTEDEPGHIYGFRERPQKQNVQLNRTCGWTVPITVVLDSVPCVHITYNANWGFWLQATYNDPYFAAQARRAVDSQ